MHRKLSAGIQQQTEGDVTDPVVSPPSGGTVYRDRQLVVDRTERPAGLRFVGEIDISNSGAISSALRQVLDGPANVHLDMRQLVFCDVSGIRALVNVAEAIGPDRRLFLHGLPPEIERVMRVVGWSDAAGFSFCGCEGLAGRVLRRPSASATRHCCTPVG